MTRASDPGAVSTTAAAARVTGLSPERLRALVRAGVVAPRRDERGRLRFTLADLGLLRSLTGLPDVRPAQVREALDAWRKAQADADAPAPKLSAPLRRGRRCVLVADAHGEYDPSTGQASLPLPESPTARTSGGATPVLELRAVTPTRPGNGVNAQELHARGRELEGADPGAARQAYRRALAIDPTSVDAALDLGRSLHVAGRLAEASELYRRVLRRHPDHGIAWFNLGVAQQDTQAWDEALVSYRKAVEHDPRCADAHFNAAHVCERVGDRLGALRHFKAYRALV